MALADPDYAAHRWMEQKKEIANMAATVKRSVVKPAAAAQGADKLVLPTERSQRVVNPWEYAYLLTGEKKIGKTSFAIEGCEELVLQCDKPQLSYELREIIVDTWAKTRKAVAALEELAGKGRGAFPYERIIVDGAGEWYNTCQIATCKKFGVSHPSEEGYARAWHYLRDDFTDVVNRLLRMQRAVGCGIFFIAHSEWKTKKSRDGTEVERIVPLLPPRCEEILNGKCDGWFMMDYVGDSRVIVLQGDEYTGAGHRIDGRFLTPSGERVREVPMGGSSSEALANFIKAFNNEQEFPTYKQMRDAARKPQPASAPTARRVARR